VAWVSGNLEVAVLAKFEEKSGMKKLSVLGILLLLMATASLALAQTSQPLSLQMQAIEGSKVTGTATITPDGAGIKVSVKLSGFPANSDHAGHIHQGKCEAQGPVVYPLTTIKADASGAGSADTSLPTVSLASLTGSTTYYVQYHEAATPPGKQVSCANIVLAAAGGGQATTAAATTAAATTAAATTAAATTKAATTAAAGQGGAPATGFGGASSQGDGFPTLLLLGGLLAVLVASGVGYTVSRQRNK
jgi:hypothetical protein